MIGPSSGSLTSGRVLTCWTRLVSILVTIILILALILLSLLFLILVLLLVAVAPPLLGGRPALIGSLVLLLGVNLVVGGEAVVQVVVIALVGAGVCLLLPSFELQCAVPHAVAHIDQQT